MSRRRLDAIVQNRDPIVFAGNVMRCRESLGWTRKRLCAEASISPQTLAQIERGRACTPGVERKLADALGTVVGRLWEDLTPNRQLLRRPSTDRWYFADPGDGERYRQRRGLTEEVEPLRLDPDALQDEAERVRLGEGGLARGFVRITTAHLEGGSVISSVLEVYDRIESNVPDGRLAYFHLLNGGIRFRVGETVHEMEAGDVLQAAMASPSWVEPLNPLRRGDPPPRVVYVDLNVRPAAPRP